MTATTATAPTGIIGTLVVNEAAVGVRECIPTNQLVVGDTVIATGFRKGGMRKLLELRIVDGTAYLRVAEGWYGYRKVYIHVYAPAAPAAQVAPAAKSAPVGDLAGEFTYVDDCVYGTDPATLVDIQKGDVLTVTEELGPRKGTTYTLVVTGARRDEFGIYIRGAEIREGRETGRKVTASTVLHRIVRCPR